ncbi:hypothetical protein [Hyphomicrobium sp.]|uniref:hypothetical protein n=1 Tax=Hyphomicrobium sp. TaxID=82 RepID=UPI000F91742A|nr:hypothetical protein [Hyphomicrobium sp.]RUO98042.1 MAG: hypothetical protein EKK30_15085 [Hyphomicrobium sp.]
MPTFSLRALLLAVSLILPLAVAQAASLDGLAVDVENQSEPVLCAEKDNVAVAFSNKNVRSFRIEAAHPVYLSPVMRANIEPDWTACDMSQDPIFKAAVPPKKITLVGQPELWLVGYTYPSFWRPATATVRIGDKVYNDIHMLQVWVLKEGRADEVLVLYPQDGYWRPRPMTPANMEVTAYGSSFLIGPIEKEGRPLVKIKEAAFDPDARQFTLSFERGGSATVKIATVDPNRIALDVAFDHGIDGGPFAMLRSMYVTEFNNDTARIAVREQGAKGWREDNVMKFDHANATDIWIGRLSPSQHNTTSPDVVFNSFSDGPTPKRPKSEIPSEVSTKPIK